MIASLTADPSSLWAPNHKMVTATITPNVVDNCDPAPVCEIVSVSSNEVDLNGDGNTDPDWEVTGSLTLELRAERSGRGNGRVYTVEVTCTDRCGNPSTDSVVVTVAHSRKKG